jgi:hypothetical protein
MAKDVDSMNANRHSLLPKINVAYKDKCSTIYKDFNHIFYYMASAKKTWNTNIWPYNRIQTWMCFTITTKWCTKWSTHS